MESTGDAVMFHRFIFGPKFQTVECREWFAVVPEEDYFKYVTVMLECRDDLIHPPLFVAISHYDKRQGWPGTQRPSLVCWLCSKIVDPGDVVIQNRQ